MTIEDRNLTRTQVLSEADCERAAESVIALRDRWIQRDAIGLYTLGAALYLDAAKPETVRVSGAEPPREGQYEDRFAVLNDLLCEHFGWLHQRVKTALTERLGQEVGYCADRALPGFHIFVSNPLHAQPTSHVPHFDRQQECLPWGRDDIEFGKAISFTLPVRLPRAGGGLKIWDVDLYEVLRLGKAQAKELIRSQRPRLHDYRLGELACHPGRLLHQIAPWPFQPHEQRVTLQGHGLWFDGRWNLYW